jgi:hypothetical protein
MAKMSSIFINQGGSKMKQYRKRNRHGRFVANPGFLTSPVTYAVGIPVLGVLGYFLIKTKVFGLLQKRPTMPVLPPSGGQQTVVIPGQGAAVGRRHFPTTATTEV